MIGVGVTYITRTGYNAHALEMSRVDAGKRCCKKMKPEAAWERCLRFSKESL